MEKKLDLYQSCVWYNRFATLNQKQRYYSIEWMATARSPSKIGHFGSYIFVYKIRYRGALEFTVNRYHTNPSQLKNKLAQTFHVIGWKYLQVGCKTPPPIIKRFLTNTTCILHLKSDVKTEMMQALNLSDCLLDGSPIVLPFRSRWRSGAIYVTQVLKDSRVLKRLLQCILSYNSFCIRTK